MKEGTFKQHAEIFLKVKDSINRKEHAEAYNRAFKKPYSFYGEHTVEECISILIEESKQ